MSEGLTRRQFIVISGSVGFTLALYGVDVGSEAGSAVAVADQSSPASLLSQPFIRIDADDSITVIAKHLDMGQGIWSGLASIVAEELDADWAQLRVEAAPADTAVYKNLIFGAQTTGGSTSIANSWLQLRMAGATVRAMLIAAAAGEWGVAASEIRIERGVLMQGDTHRARFGAFAARAATLPVPLDVVPKSRAEYRLLGTRLTRLDSAEKSAGQTRFGMDLDIEGQRIAVILRPPRFDARLLSIDAGKARAMRGVVDVLAVPSGVAVIARDTWTALRARAAVLAKWDESGAEMRSSAALAAAFRALAQGDQGRIPGMHVGDVDAVFARPDVKLLEASYEQPYLAHAPMEPIAAVCRLQDGHCDIWAGHQNQTADQKAAAAILGLPLENVHLHTLYAGGSFGRRATFNADWVTDLVQVVKASGGRYPVKLVWSREDDISGGYYRPMNHHRMQAALSAEGQVLAIRQTVVAQSFLFPRPVPGEEAKAKPDPTVLDGHFGQRYAVPNVALDWIHPAVGVPVQMFRGLSSNHTSFSKEVFADELAHAAGVDALDFRLRHLQAQPRAAAVLQLAAQRAGWGRALLPHRALGLAVQEAEKSYVAQVAEVELVDGVLRVLRVVCAVDCGFVLNPDTVVAQMEGGIGFGLSNALYGGITLDQGRVEQGNFDRYRLLRLNEMPKVEVHLMPSEADPTGVGEPGSVLIAAAVANALARLTGKPVRALPLLPLAST